MFYFNAAGDYKKELEEIVNDLMKDMQRTTEERNALVEELTDTYIEQIGERPPNQILTKLTDYVLSKDLKDKNPHKSSKTEYSLFSDSQLKRRRKKETSLHYVQEFFGSDRREHKEIGRRRRNLYEQMVVDGVYKQLEKESKLT